MNKLCLALVGTPNCGKSTLFNGLTGGRSKVANYAGVTVERRDGHFVTPAGCKVDLIDLPGIHGLAGRSIDERIAVETIAGKHGERPDGLLVLIDATDIRTHLQFVLQVRALGLPMIVALNMIDLAARDGVRIEVPKLEALLGVPVVTARATRQSGRAELLARIDQFIARDAWRAAEAPLNDVAIDLKALQREARGIAKSVILAEPVMNRLTRAVDRVVLDKRAGPIILAAILFLMFQAVFAWAAAPMAAIDAAATALSAWVTDSFAPSWARDLLTDGVIAGVGSVVIFLPQIVILFAMILLLEASGYMARAAFLMDELMLRVGLNGRAFIPLLSSFACAIPGMMAARTIENERDRLTTILVAPLMTCSARIPVYTLIIAAFIPNTNVGPFGLQGLVMFGLYMAGVISAIAVAFVLKRTITRGAAQYLLMELPTYKLPDAKDFIINLFLRAWAFLKRAGTVIFVTSVALWFLVSFPASSDGIAGSFAGRIGAGLEILLRPIGFNLQIAIALVPGMAAREVAVGALGTVYAVQGAGDGHSLAQTLGHAWSLPTALAFLAWYVYAPQCIASLAVARRETNSWAWTAFVVVYLFALAYIAAGATYWAATALGL